MEILPQKEDQHLMGKGKNYFIIPLRLLTKKKIVYNLVISDHHYILARKKLTQS